MLVRPREERRVPFPAQDGRFPGYGRHLRAASQRTWLWLLGPIMEAPAEVLTLPSAQDPAAHTAIVPVDDTLPESASRRRLHHQESPAKSIGRKLNLPA